MGLMWYWSQLRWLNSPFVALVEEETSWIELALDFQLATHLPLQVVAASGDADSSENSMERRGRVMAAASAAVAKLTKTVLWPKTGLEQKVKSKSLVLLGFTKTFGISGRPIFMCHEALMETLFRTRLAADCSEHFRSTGEPTFRVVPVFPADGSPIWNSNSHITLADSQHKRLTQHTKEIVDQIGKQRKLQKVVPISQSSRQVEWSTEEQSLIDRAKPKIKAAVMRTLLHNRCAEGLGQHIIEKYLTESGDNTARVECTRCPSGAPRVNISAWCKAKCSREGKEGISTFEKADRRRRLDIEAFNNRFPADPDWHFFEEVEDKSALEAKCFRCGLTRPWPKPARDVPVKLRIAALEYEKHDACLLKR